MRVIAQSRLKENPGKEEELKHQLRMNNIVHDSCSSRGSVNRGGGRNEADWPKGEDRRSDATAP